MSICAGARTSFRLPQSSSASSRLQNRLSQPPSPVPLAVESGAASVDPGTAQAPSSESGPELSPDARQALKYLHLAKDVRGKVSPAMLRVMPGMLQVLPDRCQAMLDELDAAGLLASDGTSLYLVAA